MNQKKTIKIQCHNYNFGRLQIQSNMRSLMDTRRFPIYINLPSNDISIAEARYIVEKLNIILKGE